MFDYKYIIETNEPLIIHSDGSKATIELKQPYEAKVLNTCESCRYCFEYPKDPTPVCRRVKFIKQPVSNNDYCSKWKIRL